MGCANSPRWCTAFDRYGLETLRLTPAATVALEGHFGGPSLTRDYGPQAVRCVSRLSADYPLAGPLSSEAGTAGVLRPTRRKRFC